MRVVISAVGRLKAGPERELAERYRDRAAKAGRAIGLRDVEVIEIRESRAQEVDRRRLEESIALANLMPEGSVLVALSERGASFDSASFARQVAAWRDNGRPAVMFVIGGADGLSPDLEARAGLTLAFGAATWPHQLVRIMLLEQLYRAVTMLAGHPYHRS
ncbi:23S rRNA (pseudouridine(1915)-N(3))-methyltransferase RlmH [Xanthobacteraceae bacterium Astr-EGSB]|uniref:23S rRNA (pseudouridine(1915)-N(3))-methyltransferase RlmH n=1 Tax=Astrobacterium formosum TaxID=3069710 RepID=UPI0027B76A75|nr:23S rRNA (pseudouridine(1915)-N(3))-methyltransferase RlmH [Xanthobacteraceae bacterium Astr-EGSB]